MERTQVIEIWLKDFREFDAPRWDVHHLGGVIAQDVLCEINNQYEYKRKVNNY